MTLQPCHICDAIKVQKSSWPLRYEIDTPKVQPGDMIHADMHGPMRVESMELANGQGKNRYWMSSIDEATRFSFLFFMQLKSESPDVFHRLMEELKGFNRANLKIFKCDQDRVYISASFHSVINEAGARIEHSPIYTGAGNAIAESYNKSIELRVVAMLRDGCAPASAWELAAICANQLHNIERINSDRRTELKDKCPSELWHNGDRPDGAFIRKFWCSAAPLNHASRLGSLEKTGRKREGTFVYVGLALKSAGFRLLDLQTGKIHETVDCNFNEDMSSRRDLLTGFDLKYSHLPTDSWGNDNIAQKAHKVRDSFYTTGKQTLEILEPIHPAQDQLHGLNLSGATSDDELVGDESLMRSIDPVSSMSAYPTDAQLRELKRISEREPVMPTRPPLSKPTAEMIRLRELRDRREITDETRTFLKQVHKIGGQIRLQQNNPKRAKSFDRYERYKNAKTIGELLDSGGSWGDVFNDYARGFLRVAMDLETARLPPVLQTLVLEEELAVYSPWMTRDCTTLNEHLECEPALICIKPALNHQARVQLHHFNDDKYKGCKGTILSHGQPVEEEGHNTDVVLLLPADNDPTSQIYRVELDSREIVLLSYHSIHLIPDSIGRFADRDDIEELIFNTIIEHLEEIDRTEKLNAARAEQIIESKSYALASMSTQLPLKAVIPTTAEEAFALGDDWKLSMIDEFLSLINMGTFTYHISAETRSDPVLSCKWVFRIKEDGRKKSRLTARGFLQQKGIDYFESYASMVASASFRIGMALNAFTGNKLRKHDAKNAYCMADLPPEEQVWMKQPPGLEIRGGQSDDIAQLLRQMGVHIPGKEGEELVLRLRKSLYGLVSAGRLFNKFIVAWALRCGFIQLRTDECIFVYTETRVLSDGSLSTLWVITLFVYVDDALSDNSSDAACLWFDKKWDSTFKSSQGSGGIADCMLNIKINRCVAEKTITLTQSHYIEDMATKFDQTTGRNYETPMAVNLDLSFDESQTVLPASVPYRQLIGSLLFTSTQTRADTAMPVNELARYMEKPQQKHWDAGLRVLRYLYLTKELGLTYCGALPPYVLNKLFANVDATWASCKQSSLSRAGWLIKFNGAAIIWGSRMIPTVCLSSAESETSAAVMCVKDILYLRLLLWELGYQQPGSTPIYEDSEATIKSVTGNAQSKQSRYYQMRTSFLRQYVRLGTINFNFTKGSEQIADPLTKPLPADIFKQHRVGILGILPERYDE
jgi:hypothetical protein